MSNRERYSCVDVDSIEPSESTCGSSRRAFMDDPDGVVSLHRVEIKADVRAHYHKRQTEVYYVLEGCGHVEVDGERLPGRPGCSVLIKPGCRHRAIGRLTVLVIVTPAYDKKDEWFD